MKSTHWILNIGMLSALAWVLPAWGQFRGMGSNMSASQAPADAEKKDDGEAAAEKALRFKDPPLIPITDDERKANCRKFEKEFISFYEKVFFVKNCKRHALTTEESSKLTREKMRPLDVDSRVIASLDEAEGYEILQMGKPDCKAYNKTYISFNLLVYYVENCQYRQFPDEASYQEHRRKNHLIDKPILYPNGPAYATLKAGLPFPSVLDDETLDEKSGFIEVMNMADACRNITDHYVTYLDSIYFINRVKFKEGEGCWREKVDASEFTRKTTRGVVLLRELTSNQAFSIPDFNPSNRKVEVK